VACRSHTWTLNQFPAAARDRLDTLLGMHAAARDVFRIAIEPVDAHGFGPALALTTYATGAMKEQALARCQSHGEWIQWLDAETV
jgi:hypothetical protein